MNVDEVNISNKCVFLLKKGVYQLLGATLKYIFCPFSSFFPFVTENDGKTCLNPEKDYLTSKGCVKHIFAGQTTHHMSVKSKLNKIKRYPVAVSNIKKL